MITTEQINHWRSVPSEHQCLEFKEAKTKYDYKKLCKYCIALANEGGGHLILEISNAPPRRVVGTSVASNPVKMAQKLLQTLSFRVDVTEVKHPDGRVIVFSIPPRPKGLAYHLEGAYLMRSGEGLVPMSQDRLRSIFFEGEPDWLEGASRTDLNAGEVVNLLDTQTFFELLNLPYPTTQQGVLYHLIQERLVDSVSDSYSIRRLGGILLAKRLQDFPDLFHKVPRVVVYSGTSKRDAQIDKQESRGYAVGFQALVNFVMSQLPRNEVIHDALRKEVTLAPEIAIRELLANSLIHQDFNISGISMIVEIYKNRVEISNPGHPVVPVERFIDGYRSRNERLADLMRRMRICEERSSGIDKVVESAEIYQLPAPDFRIADQRTVSIVFGQKDFRIMRRNDRIRACYQHCVLKYVMNERMTNQSLRNRFHLSENKSASISQVIAATIEVNLIKLDKAAGASRKFACYLPFWA